ncbi:alpha/beta fold hydrolase [Leuconostoc citreum]|uniref:alpha/beta fold hydrolase n=1 Tax=Leuconostoc citreum TaxID=33964 RepID=UPI002181F99E|nr:alpha/beta hydrolase [Leuconostoc citreum]MCS8586524.1 alpha/beta hydrolase [Leuconostoc citreum]MCS8599490.1 alpha/beta hydrolase [Leuconostoc citreum]
MHFLTSDGVQLTYTDEGTGDVVILLTGYSGIKEEWYEQTTYLRNQGFRVITLDWRSHGASTRTTKNLRVMRLAADLNELIQKTAVNNMIMIGHSMGASIIWAYITIFGQKNLKSIITIDESPKPINDAHWQSGLQGLNWDNFWLMSPHILDRPMTICEIPKNLRRRVEKQRSAYPFNKEIGFELLVDHLMQDWRRVIHQVQVPQLFILSVDSGLWQGNYRKFCEKENNIGISVKSIAHAGHLVHMEKPSTVNAFISNFLFKSMR